MSILLVQKDAQGVRAAVMADGRLCAYRGSQGNAAIHEDQIFLGVVDRAIKGVSAVFVKLPNGEFGFLPTPSGQKAPASGDRIIVQVRRPPNNAKKAFLTRDIALPGEHLVLLPLSCAVAVSSRVENAEDKQALRKLGRKIRPADMGVIMRLASLEADEESLHDEVAALTVQWQTIHSAANRISSPTLLWDGEDAIATLLQEEHGRLEYVLTNAPEVLPSALPCPVRETENPFLLHTVDHKLERSCRRTVLMKSGASLVIDRCEAMTVIDVNSGMASGSRNISVTAEKVNHEAAREIARLLRLLGIGGMIVVDFIDMDTDEAREHLMEDMREHLKNDPVKAVVHGMTTLGLMEITRRRAHTPLAALRDIPCPHCAGTGILETNEEDDADA